MYGCTDGIASGNPPPSEAPAVPFPGPISEFAKPASIHAPTDVPGATCNRHSLWNRICQGTGAATELQGKKYFPGAQGWWDENKNAICQRVKHRVKTALNRKLLQAYDNSKVRINTNEDISTMTPGGTGSPVWKHIKLTTDTIDKGVNHIQCKDDLAMAGWMGSSSGTDPFVQSDVDIAWFAATGWMDFFEWALTHEFGHALTPIHFEKKNANAAGECGPQSSLGRCRDAGQICCKDVKGDTACIRSTSCVAYSSKITHSASYNAKDKARCPYSPVPECDAGKPEAGCLGFGESGSHISAVMHHKFVADQYKKGGNRKAWRYWCM